MQILNFNANNKIFWFHTCPGKNHFDEDDEVSDFTQCPPNRITAQTAHRLCYIYCVMFGMYKYIYFYNVYSNEV